jgi:hypothetical protein
VPKLISTAYHYDGPINCIEWGPADHGCRLASCGEQGKLIIYRVNGPDLAIEFEKTTEVAMTSVAWCNLSGELTLAASGVNHSLFLFHYEWNEWVEEKFDIVGEKEFSPSFVSWSPEHPDTSMLIMGQGHTLNTWRYNRKEKSSLTNKKTRKLEMSKRINHAGIRDVTWEQSLTG